MTQKVISYIQTQRVAVLAVEMMNGAPHGATVHFAYDVKKNIFLFETYKQYRKTESLMGRDKSRASLVIGCDESNMKTLQLDGEVRLITHKEKDWYDTIYFAKFPNKLEKSTDSKFIRFVFISTWWRFTDWTGPHGKEILESK